MLRIVYVYKIENWNDLIPLPRQEKEMFPYVKKTAEFRGKVVFTGSLHY